MTGWKFPTGNRSLQQLGKFAQEFESLFGPNGESAQEEGIFRRHQKLREFSDRDGIAGRRRG